ncbi:hypothetical protein Gotur_012256 [Gossypium turneri]
MILLKKIEAVYLFHPRFGFHARCSTRSFGGYSRLTYVCFDRDLWRRFRTTIRWRNFRTPLGKCTGCRSYLSSFRNMCTSS